MDKYIVAEMVQDDKEVLVDNILLFTAYLVALFVVAAGAGMLLFAYYYL